MGKVNDKLEQLLEYLEYYIGENGFPPSVREMCVKLGIRSTASCQYYLAKLEERGDISRGGDNKKRSITLAGKKRAKFVEVPLIGTVAAGTPLFAYENLEEYYPLPDEFGNKNELFMLRVKGDSMIDAGIFDGDKVIVEKSQTAENGEIVVALVDDSATVKRLFIRDGRIILHPENKTMKDILPDEATILGKVKGLVRRF